MIESMIVIIGLNAALLVFHCEYEDGFFGRIALAGLVLVATIVGIARFRLDYEYDMDLSIQLMIACFMVFLARHTYRWWRAVRALKHGNRRES